MSSSSPHLVLSDHPLGHIAYFVSSCPSLSHSRFYSLFLSLTHSVTHTTFQFSEHYNVITKPYTRGFLFLTVKCVCVCVCVCVCIWAVCTCIVKHHAHMILRCKNWKDNNHTRTCTNTSVIDTIHSHKLYRKSRDRTYEEICQSGVQLKNGRCKY